jgi:hypothetical protein
MTHDQIQEVAMAMMDLRHVGWHLPGAPCVHIVESPSADDLLTERQEGIALAAALRQARIPSRYYLATTKETFKSALDLIASQRMFCATRPICLHISCHGNDDKIGLTSREVLVWDELRTMLLEFGVKSCSYFGDERDKVSTLMLCMSSCFGLSAVKMTNTNERPFMSLIAPHIPVSWSDSLTAYLTYYNLFLLKNKTCGEALQAMNVAAGEQNLFHVADFSHEVQAWMAKNSTQS